MGKAISSEWRNGRWTAKATLLETTSANVQGDWFFLQGFRPWTLTVVGDLSGNLRIRVANQLGEPTAAIGQFPVLDQVITAPTILNLDIPIMWACVEITDYVSGSARVDWIAG